MSIESQLETLQYLSTCKADVVPGYTLSRCEFLPAYGVKDSVNSILQVNCSVCSEVQAYQMAKLLINGSSPLEERARISEFLTSNLGKRGVAFNKTITITTENQEPILTEIVEIAERLVGFCENISEETQELSDDYRNALTPPKAQTLEDIEKLRGKIERFSGALYQAQSLYLQMKGHLKKAIRLDLEDLKFLRDWIVFFGLHSLIRQKKGLLPDRMDLYLTPNSDQLIKANKTDL